MSSEQLLLGFSDRLAAIRRKATDDEMALVDRFRTSFPDLYELLHRHMPPAAEHSRAHYQATIPTADLGKLVEILLAGQPTVSLTPSAAAQRLRTAGYWRAALTPATCGRLLARLSREGLPGVVVAARRAGRVRRVEISRS